MDPETAVNQPNTHGPYRGVVANAPLKPEYEKEAIGEGEFSKSVLDGVEARGKPSNSSLRTVNPIIGLEFRSIPLTTISKKCLPFRMSRHLNPPLRSRSL